MIKEVAGWILNNLFYPLNQVLINAERVLDPNVDWAKVTDDNLQ